MKSCRFSVEQFCELPDGHDEAHDFNILEDRVIEAARNLSVSIWNVEPNKLWHSPNAENLAIALREALRRYDAKGK